MARALPATGSAKSMGRVRKSWFGSKPGAAANVQLRGTLGAKIGITSGSISLSSSFGARYADYDTTDSDN